MPEMNGYEATRAIRSMDRPEGRRPAHHRHDGQCLCRGRAGFPGRRHDGPCGQAHRRGCPAGYAAQGAALNPTPPQTGRGKPFQPPLRGRPDSKTPRYGGANGDAEKELERLLGHGLGGAHGAWRLQREKSGGSMKRRPRRPVPSSPFSEINTSPENVTVIEEIISGFMKENPTIRVSYESLKGRDYYEALRKRMAAGKGDDVFIVDHDTVLELGAQGQLADLSGLSCIASYDERMLGQMREPGQDLLGADHSVGLWVVLQSGPITAARPKDARRTCRSGSRFVAILCSRASRRSLPTTTSP